MLLAVAAERGARVVREGVDIEVVERQVAVGGQLHRAARHGGHLHGDLPAAARRSTRRTTRCSRSPRSRRCSPAARALDRRRRRGRRSPTSTRPGRLEVVRAEPDDPGRRRAQPRRGRGARRGARGGVRRSQRLVGVVGVMADKDAEGILAALEPLLAEVVVTRAVARRARIDVDDLAEIARRRVRRGPRARRRAARRRASTLAVAAAPRARPSAAPACSSPGRSCSSPRRGCCSVAPDLRVTRSGDAARTCSGRARSRLDGR